MRLLDRYLLRELAGPLVFCFGLFFTLWVAFDLFSELGRLQENLRGADEFLLYYLFRLPELLQVAVPIGLLLGLLYALTTHARHHELTAIRAAGVSLWRLALPYLAVGFVFTLGMFAVNELWEPRGSAAAQELLRRRVEKKKAEAAPPAFQRIPFRNDREGRFWMLDYNQATHEMRNVQVDTMLADGSRRVFAADRGVRSNGVWLFFNARQHMEVPGNVFPVNRVITNCIAMPEFTETPEQIKSEINIKGRLDSWQGDRADWPLTEIINYLRLHPKLQGEVRAKLYTKLHGRLAAPWTCLVVVLIALPFGAATGRRNVFVGVASGIFICFAYFILMQLGLALGAGGKVPPWLAAWLPNLFFAGTSMFFIFRVR
jgi:lipopolysaccharide export system permease protein